MKATTYNPIVNADASDVVTGDHELTVINGKAEASENEDDGEEDGTIGSDEDDQVANTDDADRSAADEAEVAARGSFRELLLPIHLPWFTMNFGNSMAAVLVPVFAAEVHRGMHTSECATSKSGSAPLKRRLMLARARPDRDARPAPRRRRRGRRCRGARACRIERTSGPHGAGERTNNQKGANERVGSRMARRAPASELWCGVVLSRPPSCRIPHPKNRRRARSTRRRRDTPSLRSARWRRARRAAVSRSASRWPSPAPGYRPRR